MRFSVWFGEVSCGLFELVSSLESSPEGTGIGKAVAITSSSPREKATGLKALVQKEFIAEFLEGDGALFPSWWA